MGKHIAPYASLVGSFVLYKGGLAKIEAVRSCLNYQVFYKLRFAHGGSCFAPVGSCELVRKAS